MANEPYYFPSVSTIKSPTPIRQNCFKAHIFCALPYHLFHFLFVFGSVLCQNLRIYNRKKFGFWHVYLSFHQTRLPLCSLIKHILMWIVNGIDWRIASTHACVIIFPRVEKKKNTSKMLLDCKLAYLTSRRATGNSWLAKCTCTQFDSYTTILIQPSLFWHDSSPSLARHRAFSLHAMLF